MVNRRTAFLLGVFSRAGGFLQVIKIVRRMKLREMLMPVFHQQNLYLHIAALLGMLDGVVDEFRKRLRRHDFIRGQQGQPSFYHTAFLKKEQDTPKGVR